VGDNWIGYANDCLQYYMGIKADELTDEQWSNKVAFLIDIRKKEAAEKRPFMFKF
jgi:hypothetical protein